MADRRRALLSIRTFLPRVFADSRPCSSASSSVFHAATSASAVTSTPARPLIAQRELPFLQPHETPRKCWLETLRRVEEAGSERVGVVDLHPHVFAFSMRTDLLWDNLQWQKTYREVNWEHEQNRYEMEGGGHKPWPQKGTGRARHASIRAPQWKNGGKVNGKRAPTSFYYELPKKMRVDGLRSVLTYKYLQGDLRIVDSLELESEDPAELEALAVEHGWGISTLIVGASDRIPPKLAVATSTLCNFNVMPVYGFNVFSALKHDTLVMDLAALEQMESKLLTAIYANEIHYPRNPPMAWPDPAIKGQFKFKTFEDKDWDIEDRFLKMPFTPRGDGHVTVEVGEGPSKTKKRVQDPIPPVPKKKWHREGEEGRWVYQFEDIESENN